MSSNWTLRFPRTSKEVYGYWVAFENTTTRGVGWVIAIILAFCVGVFIGGL